MKLSVFQVNKLWYCYYKLSNFLSVIVVVCGCACLCCSCLIHKRAKRNRHYIAFTNSNTPKEELELDDKDAQKVLQSQYRQLPDTENVYDELPTTL